MTVPSPGRLSIAEAGAALRAGTITAVGPEDAIPIGFAANGLPLGAQIVGRPFDEPTGLRIGAAYEAATGLWRADSYDNQIRPQLPLSAEAA